MKMIEFDGQYAEKFVSATTLLQQQEKAAQCCRALYTDASCDADVKGWLSCDEAAVQRTEIKQIAQEIRANADVFVLVGVGGSNQAARAMIEALQAEDDTVEIVYAGNTLSAHAIQKILRKIENKSVYINVIAKNFETLEPGSHFRLLRKAMQARYSAEEMAKRVVLTGSYGSRLEEIAHENGYRFLSFPQKIGGRYSAFSPVCLLPAAVAGLDIDAYLQGGQAMEEHVRTCEKNIAVQYAALRTALYNAGFGIELLASFEPQLDWLTQWWIQLFGESEGKENGGIFPAAVIYSEDLHAMGQYLQEGQRCLSETFLAVRDAKASVIVQPDRDFNDGFDYLDGMDFAKINEAAQQATLEAHTQGGVPCTVLSVPMLNEYYYGQLYYFFMAACAVSGKVLGINPFDQNGVEAYKQSMFQKLGKQ